MRNVLGLLLMLVGALLGTVATAHATVTLGNTDIQSTSIEMRDV